jgi:hypothetical protein
MQRLEAQPVFSGDIVFALPLVEWHDRNAMLARNQSV